MYWRRIAIADVPIRDADAFEAWLHAQWRIKDDLIEHFHQHGKFPPNASHVTDQSPSQQQDTAFIETTVRLPTLLDIAQIFLPMATTGLVMNIAYQLWHFKSH